MISLSACWWKTDETPQRDSLHSKGFIWFAYNLSTPQVFKVAQTSEEHMIRLTAEVISCFFLSFYHSFPMKCAFAWNICPPVLHLCVMLLRLSLMLFLACFKGHISVTDCANGACDTLLDNSHVCVKRNLAENSQNDELHQFPTVLDL